MAEIELGESDSLVVVDQSFQTSPRMLLAARALAVILVSYFVIQFAWISDDALITVRTALNASQGYGPVFNIDERVQAYTHPIWFLIIWFSGSLTNQWILMPMLLGVLFTAAAVIVIICKTSSLSRIALFATGLVLSNAFIEYATSGLENALSYFLLALYLVGIGGLLKNRNLVLALAFGVLVSLILLNRLDLALLVLPLLAYLYWQFRRDLKILAGLTCGIVIPLLAWFLFSYVYYGSLLPNTFLAKTNLDISKAELLLAGVRYLYVSAINDPVTMIILVAGSVFGLIFGTTKTRLAIAGVWVYLAYVVWVGGDFMAGRFLAVPVFVTLSSLVLENSNHYLKSIPTIAGRQDREVIRFGVASLLLLLLIFGWNKSGALTDENTNAIRWAWQETGGVSDERGEYVGQSRGLWDFLFDFRVINQPHKTLESPETALLPTDSVEIHAAASAWYPDAEVKEVAIRCGGLGARSILAGPTVHYVDPCALTDAYLAAQPFTPEKFNWRTGHFARSIPEGYVEAIQLNDPSYVKDRVAREKLIETWKNIRN